MVWGAQKGWTPESLSLLWGSRGRGRQWLPALASLQPAGATWLSWPICPSLSWQRRSQRFDLLVEPARPMSCSKRSRPSSAKAKQRLSQLTFRKAPRLASQGSRQPYVFSSHFPEFYLGKGDLCSWKVKTVGPDASCSLGSWNDVVEDDLGLLILLHVVITSMCHHDLQF